MEFRVLFAQDIAAALQYVGNMSVRDLRRTQIIAAARSLVAEGGLEALTIGGLEKRLAFTRGVITYHFRDKDEIVGAVLESAVAEMDDQTFAEARQPDNFDDKLRAVFESKVQSFLSHAEARAILISFWSRLPSDPRAKELNHRLFSGWRAQGTVLFKAGISAGVWRKDLDAEAAAALLVGLVVGVTAQVAFEGDLELDRLVEQGYQMVRSHAHGARS